MCTRSYCCAAPMPLWRKHGTPLQYSRLENPMDGGAWWAAVHGVAKSQTRLSDFTFTFQFHALEKEMAIHSCVLAWRTPGTEEPGGLLSMGSHRVGHDWSDLAAAAAAAACPFSPPVSSRVALMDSSPHTDGFLSPPSQPLCLATHKGFLQCLQSLQHYSAWDLMPPGLNGG